MGDSPYRHCSRCGSAEFSVVSTREFICSVCGYRHFITPVPAAVALILDAEDRLLVTRRAHEPGLGKLGLPGGIIEPGETGEQAAARETAEEVGLIIPPDSFTYLTTLPNLYWFQDYLWPTLDLFYLARVTDFAEIRKCPHEVSEVLTPLLPGVTFADFAFVSNAEAVRKLQELRATGLL